MSNHKGHEGTQRRNELNSKIQLQEEKRKALLKSQDEFNKSRAESRSKMGLSGKDLGEK